MKKIENRFKILKSAFELTRNTVGKQKAETGIYYFGNEKTKIIEKAVFDDSQRTHCTWTFNPDFINPIIKDMWENKGLALIGFGHSHPRGYTHPSPQDIDVFTKYLNRFKTNILYTPIIQSSYDNMPYEFYPYVKIKGNSASCEILELDIIDDKEDVLTTPYDIFEEIKKGSFDYPGCTKKHDTLSQINTSKFELDYSRITDSVDLELLHNSKVLIVGAGGAFHLYEWLARTGVGHIVACDFDVIENTNLVRQGHHISSIGRTKVSALKEHIKMEINPNIKFDILEKDLTKLRDKEYEDYISNCDIMLFLTDSFNAQAFGNKLALKYNRPAVWAGFYTKSRCAEIVFYIPNVTPSCFRCAVSSRYEAQEKKTVKISSNSNTIFHSAMLDSFIGFLSMAILHNKTKGFEFSNWFGSYWDRNLIQIKTHPEYAGVFKAKLNNIPLLNNFCVVWQKIEKEQKPKYENCPDCVQ